jgi:lactate dehydrogenase-like 2-hydroxyacid dehydrogenase
LSDAKASLKRHEAGVVMHTGVTILRTMAFPETTDRQLEECFTVVDLPKERAEAARMLSDRGGEMRGIAARRAVLTAGDLAQMPNLEIIANFGAGLDGIDVDAARKRGIKIQTGAPAVADDVADLAVASAVALLRGIVRGDDFVRIRRWERGEFQLGRSLLGLKAGVVGLGHIGLAVAKRLEVMRCEVAYFGPRRKPTDYAYFSDIVALAEWAQLLIVACPATPETQRLIDSRVLRALGAQGYLVNVSRGVVVDESALIEALAQDGLGGAALDVFEQEPFVPEALLKDRRVVLTPHIGGGTLETHQRLGDNVLKALLDHFGSASKSSQK